MELQRGRAGCETIVSCMLAEAGGHTHWKSERSSSSSCSAGESAVASSSSGSPGGWSSSNCMRGVMGLMQAPRGSVRRVHRKGGGGGQAHTWSVRQAHIKE